MLVRRHNLPVWVHTEAEAARAVSLSKTFLPKPGGLYKARAGHRPQRPRPPVSGSFPNHHTNPARVLQAKRPIQVEAGRCLALRLVGPQEGLGSEDQLQVLVADRQRATRWLQASEVLSERQAQAWSRFGF